MAKLTQPDTTEGYKAFLRALRLVGIALTESHFRIDRQRYFEDEEESIFVDLVCETFEVKERHFELKMKMSVKSSRPRSQSGSLLLEATYLLHYHTRVRTAPELVRRFAENEARIVIWPYLREYVTSMCGRAHVPPISLPMAVNEFS
jgi:preprotein translocase subunit SecB